MVDARNADGFAARVFIDEKTHLPLMVTYQGPQPRMVTAGGPPPGSGAGAGAQAPARPASQVDPKQLADEAKKQIDQMQKQPPVMVEYAALLRRLARGRRRSSFRTRCAARWQGRLQRSGR